MDKDRWKSERRAYESQPISSFQQNVQEIMTEVIIVQNINVKAADGKVIRLQYKIS